MAFQAKFDGRCVDCGDGIRVGDMIEYTEAGKIAHAVCDPDVDTLTLRPSETVCTECWIVRPCGCEVG